MNGEATFIVGTKVHVRVLIFFTGSHSSGGGTSRGFLAPAGVPRHSSGGTLTNTLARLLVGALPASQPSYYNQPSYSSIII